MLARIRRGKSTPRVLRAAKGNRHCARQRRADPRNCTRNSWPRVWPWRPAPVGRQCGPHGMFAGRCNYQPELWRGRADRSASPAPNCSTTTGSPPCACTVLTPLLDQDPSAVLWALHWYRLAKFADAPDGEGTRAAPVPAHPCWTVIPQRAKIPAPKFGARAGAPPSDQRSG
jgi:hypothetical protein